MQICNKNSKILINNYQFQMGNQLTGDQQNGQVLNAVLTKLPQMMQQQQSAPANSKSLTKLRNSKFIRGDEGPDSEIKVNQLNPNRTSSPIRGFNSDTKISTMRPILQTSQAQSIHQNQPQIKPPTTRPQTSKPLNIFQQLFGSDNEQGNQRLRSSSASHVSMSNSNRKIALLESNVQVSERKVQQLSKTIQSLQNNLRNSESRVIVGQSNFQKTQGRCLYLQSQVKSLQQDIANLNTLINQKNSMLYQKDKHISELELHLRTQRNQLQLQESRLNQFATREQRKDKEIAQLSTTKFELNSTKILLENNLKIAQAGLEQKLRNIEELENLVGKKDKEIDVRNKQRTQLENTTIALKDELADNLSKHQSQIESLHSNIREHLMAIDEYQARILQLTHKIDKLYYQQIENQSVIAKLRDEYSELLSQKTHVCQQLDQCRAQLQSTRINHQQDKQEKARHMQKGDKIMAQYINAKKVGQKQIEFLENKVEQLGREKQKLIEELDVTKAIAIERNKLFERSVIYELKQENDRLWQKLIAKSSKQADQDTQNPEYWNNKIGHFKLTQKAEIIELSQENKNPLELRFEGFLKKLEGREQVNHDKKEKEKESMTRDISSHSLAELHESVAFYKQKCNQLEKMVEDHIVLNKSLKDQIEKYNNYELAFQVYKRQVEDLKNQNKELQEINYKLYSALNSDTLSTKIVQVRDSLQQIKLLTKEAAHKELIPQLADKCVGVLGSCLAQCEKVKRLK